MTHENIFFLPLTLINYPYLRDKKTYIQDHYSNLNIQNNYIDVIHATPLVPALLKLLKICLTQVTKIYAHSKVRQNLTHSLKKTL